MLIELSKVKLNRAEAEKIEERLSNWDKLHRDVVIDPPSLVELEKMIHVETATRKRMIIATRLLGMYHRVAREENVRRIVKALGAK